MNCVFCEDNVIVTVVPFLDNSHQITMSVDGSDTPERCEYNPCTDEHLGV